MKCVICGVGTVRPGQASSLLERGSTTLIFREVPGGVCDTCGELYTDEATTVALLLELDKAVAAGVRLEERLFSGASAQPAPNFVG